MTLNRWCKALRRTQSRRAPRFKAIGALAAVLPFVAGCGLRAMLSGHFEPPVVTLGASMVESISPSTAVVHFELTVRNPNAFGLTTRAVACHLSFNHHALAAGESAHRVTVPAHASSPLEVRMEVPFPALGAAAPDALMLGEIPYDLEGTLRVASFLFTREIPFTVSSVLRINLLEVAGPPRSPSPPEAGTPGSLSALEAGNAP